MAGDLLVGKDAIGAQFGDTGPFAVQCPLQRGQRMTLAQGALVVGAEHTAIVEEAKGSAVKGGLSVTLQLTVLCTAGKLQRVH